MKVISKSRLASYPRPLQGGVRVLGPARQRTLGGEYQAALDKANAANEARYQGILQGYDDLSKNIRGTLDGVGDQEYRDIDRQYKQMGSDVYQRLVNRGFANSTLPATQQMGVERERSGARSRLASQLAQQQANYDMNIAQGKFGVMERRNDIAPDPAMLANLSQGLGQAGYGGGPMQIGQPIGITPGQYQMAYQQALAQHMGMMPGGMMGGGGGRSPWQMDRIANARALRRERAAASGPMRIAQAEKVRARNLARPKRSYTSLPQWTVSAGGVNATVPGPWRQGYGVGNVAPGVVGPYRTGFQPAAIDRSLNGAWIPPEDVQKLQRRQNTLDYPPPFGAGRDPRGTFGGLYFSANYHEL